MPEKHGIITKVLYHVWVPFLLYAGLIAADIFHNNAASPTSQEALGCMVLSLILMCVAFYIVAKIARPENSVFFWHTPLTAKTLYWNYFLKHDLSLLWTFLVAPVLISAALLNGNAILAGSLLSIFGFLLVSTTGFILLTQELRWYMIMANPYLGVAVLLNKQIKLGPRIRVNGWSVITLFAILGFTIGSFVPPYSPWEATGSAILRCFQVLRQIPLIGSILSYLFCPILEIGLILNNLSGQIQSLVAVLTFQLVMLILQLPLLKQTLTENQPHWRMQEEISGSHPVTGGTEEVRSPNLPRESETTSGNHNNWLTIAYVYVLIVTGMFTYQASLQTLIVSIVIITVLFYLFVPAAYLTFKMTDSMIWWPAKRNKSLVKALAGNWWGWALVCASVLTLHYIASWPARHLYWLLPAALAGRFAIPAIIVFSHHWNLGRKTAGLLHAFGCLIGLVGALILTTGVSLHGWTSPHLDIEKLTICGACILMPLITASFALRYETRATGKQLYTAIK